MFSKILIWGCIIFACLAQIGYAETCKDKGKDQNQGNVRWLKVEGRDSLIICTTGDESTRRQVASPVNFDKWTALNSSQPCEYRRSTVTCACIIAKAGDCAFHRE